MDKKNRRLRDFFVLDVQRICTVLLIVAVSYSVFVAIAQGQSRQSLRDELTQRGDIVAALVAVHDEKLSSVASRLDKIDNRLDGLQLERRLTQIEWYIESQKDSQKLQLGMLSALVLLCIDKAAGWFKSKVAA